MTSTRPVRLEPSGHRVVEAFLCEHEDVVTLSEARWLRARVFESEPTAEAVRRLWVQVQLVLDVAKPAVDLRRDPPERRPSGHPLVEDFIDAYAHCVTVAQAARLRRLVFPEGAPVTMEMLTGLWTLLHYETLVRDRCVAGEPGRELIEQLLAQLVHDAVAGLGAVGEA